MRHSKKINVKVVLQEADFKTLISGGVVTTQVIDAPYGEVKIILCDIGYERMIEIINQKTREQ